MNEFNFNKFSGAPSDFAHNIRTIYFVDTVNENLKNEAKNNKLYLLKEKEKFDDEKELRDTIFYPSLELQKILKQIKLILGNENKFNQFAGHVQFFDKFENRINFLFDNFKPPNIKNNLIKITYEDMNNDNKLSLIHRVGNASINYLSHAKIILQKRKDEKIRFLFEKNKIKKKYNYYKKLSSAHVYNSKEEIEKIIYKDYYRNENDLNPERENISFEEAMELKNYFETKKEKFNNVCISEQRSREFVFDCLNINFDSKKNILII